MVPHFREKRTDAVKRRGAARVERRASEPGAEWGERDSVCRLLALTDWLKELQCFFFAMAPHTQRERGKEIQWMYVLNGNQKELEMCMLNYLQKSTWGRMWKCHVVGDYSNLHMKVKGMLHFTVDVLQRWGFLIASLSFCCLSLQCMSCLHCCYPHNHSLPICGSLHNFIYIYKLYN